MRNTLTFLHVWLDTLFLITMLYTAEILYLKSLLLRKCSLNVCCSTSKAAHFRRRPDTSTACSGATCCLTNTACFFTLSHLSGSSCRQTDRCRDRYREGEKSEEGRIDRWWIARRKCMKQRFKKAKKKEEKLLCLSWKKQTKQSGLENNRRWLNIAPYL